MGKITEEYINQLVKESKAQLPEKTVEKLKAQSGRTLTNEQILLINDQINKMTIANFVGYLMYGIIKEENLELFTQMSSERMDIAKAFIDRSKEKCIPKVPEQPSTPNPTPIKRYLNIMIAVIAILSLLCLFYVKKTERDKKNNRESILQALADKMVTIPGGTFTMGATIGDTIDNEKPSHLVTISTFRLSKYEVTQEEWEAVMGNNPSKFKGNNCPVGNVSWNDCQEFVKKLNQITGKNYRLPTEAEWEYAARGGISNGCKYAGSDNIDKVAWTLSNSDMTTHKVGQKQPNELGLYDMTGNVYEYCADEWYCYSDSSQINPTHPGNNNSKRIIRGGSCDNSAENCRITSRRPVYPNDVYSGFGLRLAY